MGHPASAHRPQERVAHTPMLYVPGWASGCVRGWARAVAGAVKTCWSQNVLGMLRFATICCECVAVVILAALDGGPSPLSSGAVTASLPQHICLYYFMLTTGVLSSRACTHPVARPVPGACQVSHLMPANLVQALGCGSSAA